MPGAEAPREAAVLVPLLRGADGDRLVMIRRSPGGVHGGQLAFPGGKREPMDATLLDTAVREAVEETGLDPADVAVLAQLPVVDTWTTRFRVAPFLARVRRPARWRPQLDEVAEVIEISVGDLTAPDARRETVMNFPTWPEPKLTPYFALPGERRVWGLTYRILEPLVPRLQAGDWG